MSKPSPNPWAFQRVGDHVSITSPARFGTSVADVFERSAKARPGDPDAISSTECDANARLITMAPELLAIAEDALLTWEGELVGITPGQWPAQEARITKARAVIAKAKGLTP